MGPHQAGGLWGAWRLIAVDTNLLVHAHRQDSEWFGKAAPLVRDLATSPRPWAIPWPCIAELTAIVTHPRIFRTPTPLVASLEQVDAWLESRSLSLLAEGPAAWRTLRRLLRDSKVIGPRVHDARVAALCLAHGTTELWSADRDFARFPELRVRKPARRSTR